jgi:hypothetical protein
VLGREGLTRGKRALDNGDETLAWAIAQGDSPT